MKLRENDELIYCVLYIIMGTWYTEEKYYVNTR